MKLFKKGKLIVHSGVFHADDVMAAAFCRLLNPDVEIIRTFDYQRYINDPEAIIADIGGGKYDHHEPEQLKERRANKCPYAAFGKLVRDFYPDIMSEEVYQKLDKTFIQPMDLTDNCGGPNTLSQALGSFNKNWNSNNTSDECFYKALDIAISILKSEIATLKSKVAAKDKAANALMINGVAYLDEYAPVNDYLPEECLFVGSNSLRGGYQIIAVREKGGLNKRLFPERYRLGNDIDIEGITFCHSSGFTATFKTKESAMKFFEDHKAEDFPLDPRKYQ